MMDRFQIEYVHTFEIGNATIRISTFDSEANEIHLDLFFIDFSDIFV